MIGASRRFGLSSSQPCHIVQPHETRKMTDIVDQGP